MDFFKFWDKYCPIFSIFIVISICGQHGSRLSRHFANQDSFADKKLPPKYLNTIKKKGKRKVQGVPQLQAEAFPKHQEEEETDKTKQAQIEQMYEKH